MLTAVVVGVTTTMTSEVGGVSANDKPLIGVGGGVGDGVGGGVGGSVAGGVGGGGTYGHTRALR